MIKTNKRKVIFIGELVCLLKEYFETVRNLKILLRNQCKFGEIESCYLITALTDTGLYDNRNIDCKKIKKLVEELELESKIAN